MSHKSVSEHFVVDIIQEMFLLSSCEIFVETCCWRENSLPADQKLYSCSLPDPWLTNTQLYQKLASLQSTILGLSSITYCYTWPYFFKVTFSCPFHSTPNTAMSFATCFFLTPALQPPIIVFCISTDPLWGGYWISQTFIPWKAFTTLPGILTASGISTNKWKKILQFLQISIQI